MSVKPIPDGYHTVTPYLVVPGVAKLIDFLKEAFAAQEMFRMPGPDGRIAHAELKIGDSMVMMADSSETYPPMPTMIHLYMEDVDGVYQRALKAGATSVREPADQFYGDRTAGVRDASGNQWYIATHTEDLSPEEMSRRAEAASQGAG
jgi:uncharacterized glyoxalase superfamily protein PhnB